MKLVNISVHILGNSVHFGELFAQFASLIWYVFNWYFFVFQLGLMSSYAVWAVSRSFSMFLLSRVIGGICKGNVSLCTAMIADLPCPKARNKGMVSTVHKAHAMIFF